MPLRDEVLKTLLYYDIWSYPLTADELYTFLPVNSITLDQFKASLAEEIDGKTLHEQDGFYFVEGRTSAIIEDRQRRSRHAKRLWFMARFSMHVIKRFPFVRAVFVSGDLSKNATHAGSDVDFFILTEPGRLWITRSLLILFKKVFLLNRKKYFCLNSFATTDNLELSEQNIFLATEIATLKPLYNRALFDQYLEANSWNKRYFPNFDIAHLSLPTTNDRSSIVQKMLEFPFRFVNANRLDEILMNKMERVWEKRYPACNEETRKRIFKCTRQESRAYVGDFESKILERYTQRLKDFGISN